MKILCALGQHNYGDPYRGESYEYVNFLPALKALGHEVALFDTWRRDRFKDFAELNRELLRQVDHHRPDVLFTVLLGYEVWLETLDVIRAAFGCRIINWGTDDSWKYAEFSRYICRHVDLWATTSETAVQRASRDRLQNFFLTQWAASTHQISEPRPASECTHAVSFVGTAYGNRRRWIEGLRARGISVECFGHGWPAGPVGTTELLGIYRNSLLTLNFGDSGLHVSGIAPYRSRQMKARVFEVLGAGGCLLTEDCHELSRYYTPGREVITFSSVDDLARCIEYYSSHPKQRDAIARAGHERTRAEHTYERRFKTLLANVVARPGPDYDRSRSASGVLLPRKEFEHIAEAHSKATHRLRWLRWVLAVGPMFVWGRKRGRRAARRLAFELSWRLVGARTYTSRGLPGRLFYSES